MKLNSSTNVEKSTEAAIAPMQCYRKPWRVLNLYACLGGNRYKWEDCEITAVELDPELARLYQERFPNDKVVIADAHQYLLNHYKEFDFIWSSPPCQSHSKVRMMASKGGSYDAVMPDMRLWAEIIFLQNFTKNTDIKFVVENVKPYYEPFVKPTAKLGRHLFWSNFEIPQTEIKDGLTHNERGSSEKGYFDLRPYKMEHRKDQIIRNCVDPNVGEYVFRCALGNCM